MILSKLFWEITVVGMICACVWVSAVSGMCHSPQKLQTSQKLPKSPKNTQKTLKNAKKYVRTQNIEQKNL